MANSLGGFKSQRNGGLWLKHLSPFNEEYINIIDSFINNEKINIYGEEAIKLVVQKISENDLVYITKNHKKLLPLFALLNPHLLYYVEFWEIDPDEQQEIFGAVLI